MADVAEPMVDTGSGFAGVDSVNLPFLDGPANGNQAEDTTADTPDGEQPEGQVADGEQVADGDGEVAPVYSKDSVLDELINKFAKDHPNLDPTTPEGLKILNRMANQEKYIRELKSKAASPQDGLTEWERSLLKPVAAAQPETTQAKPEAAATPVTGAQPYFDGDPGVAWKGPADAYNELSAAWSKTDAAGNPMPDHAAINRIDLGIFERRASEMGYVKAPRVAQLIEQAIQERLGDVLPNIRETVQSQRTQANKEFAVAELSKSADWANVAELETVDSKDPLVFEGESFPNTPLNRILATNPEILDINVKHKDADTAERLTYLARFRAAARIAKTGQADAGKVKQALEAGAKQRDRELGDRVRQSLNGGLTATGKPNGKKTGSLVHELVNDGGPRSFNSY